MKLQKVATTTTQNEPPPTTTFTSFDMNRKVRLVPQFTELSFFFSSHFEKVADNLYWPSESHTMLLQSVLIGKGHEVQHFQ